MLVTKSSLIVAAAAALLSSSGECRNLRSLTTFAKIGDYTPGSNVVPHSKIDLDLQDIDAYIGAQNWTAAKDVYKNGRWSAKSNSMRTLQGFSTGADAKMSGEPLYKMYKTYWGSPTYADEFVLAALDGTGMLAGAADIARDECANKGIHYQNVWMYVVHELEDAIGDCKNGQVGDNDAGVHAWDEGWAFYAGSLLVGAETKGKSVYALAEKRCVNYKTCKSGFTGVSKVNDEMVKLYQEGQTDIQNFECAAAQTKMERIKTLMTIPLVQGTLRYAYKSDPNTLAGGAKERAEGWAFAAAILPQIDACNSVNAKLVRDNMRYDASSPIKDGFAKVFKAIQECYPQMGITCDDVGGLYNGNAADSSPYTGTDVATCKVNNPPKATAPNSAAFPVVPVVAAIGGVVAFGVLLMVCSGSPDTRQSA